MEIEHKKKLSKKDKEQLTKYAKNEIKEWKQFIKEINKKGNGEPRLNNFHQ